MIVVGGNYERVTASGTTQHKLYIGDYALVTQNGSTSTVSYLLRDHLGSLTAVLDKTGNVLEKLSYDAWGKRRNLNGSGINLSVLYAFKPQFSERGYTGHKHVDSMGLIHMNGRVYDPVIARFLSADPIIQAPSNLQSLNRYSYVINNPLSYTDPSGYGWKGWKKIRGIIKAVAAIALAFTCGGESYACAVVMVRLAESSKKDFHNYNREKKGLPSEGSSWGTVTIGVSVPFDHGSFDNSKPVKPSSSYNQPSNTGSGTGTVGSPGVTSSPSALAQYGIAGTCAHPRDCGVILPNDSSGAPITAGQQAFADSGKYKEFWQSRYESGDPVARTALIGWGNAASVGATSFEKLAAGYAWSSLENYISINRLTVSMSEIGAELAKAHARAVSRDDINIPHHLSPKQVGDYHHEVFTNHGIPPHLFGGTQPIPFMPNAEMDIIFDRPRPMFNANTYSGIWCNGCDTRP